LLGVNSKSPIQDGANTILGILVEVGCLEIQGTLYRNIFEYSPRLMVESYLATKGNPSKIVLGCGHANSRELLEAVGLKDEVWCGACTKLPHADALVVSLDESSSDVLCDLKHPDFWEAFPAKSVQEIHDETWCPDCYTPETIHAMVGVLKAGGIFSSNTPTPELKSAFMAQGFNVVEENKELHTITLKKTR
jgi:hypothetical protein